ncbi:MAG TPA: 4Fe-4S dicluster domain-containing protein [Chloroflexi bacterium]|nr:4Fe-4S dicluster domain-containing protein [Chloroflexota bacterium]
MGLLGSLFDYERRRSKALAAGRVVPDSSRCVQCGICSFNCPLGIDVRAHAWRGEPVNGGHCITCGECVARCPRGALRFEQIPHSLERILSNTF